MNHPRTLTLYRFSAVFLLVVAAVGVRLALAPRPPDPLRGDSDEAVGALADRLDALSEREQAAQLSRYLSDPAPGLRFAAVDRLAARGTSDPATASRLAAAYTDSSSAVRQRVIEILPDVDEKRGMRLLLAALADED